MYTVVINGKEIYRTNKAKDAIQLGEDMVREYRQFSMKRDIGYEVLVVDISDTLRPVMMIEFSCRYSTNATDYIQI